jgi:hypothetical protein
MFHFKNSEILHSFSCDKDTFLIKTTVKELLKVKVINWKYNRPPDEIRCKEIREYFTKPNTIFNTPFHLYYNEKFDDFECLDGIHRYTSIKNLEIDKVIFMFLYLKKSEGELIDIFKNINKCISVPELYLSNEYSLSNKQIIETVANEWKNKYEIHFTPNKDFRVPNMNRDMFICILTNILDDHKIRTKGRLEEILENANVFISKNYGRYNKKVTTIQLDKCKKSGCYLFLIKDSSIKEHVIPIVTNKDKIS